MQKMLMKKPAKIANTFSSAEVKNDPDVIANWEKRGYKKAGIVEDDMQRPAMALKREGGLLANMGEEDLATMKAKAAAAKASKGKKVDKEPDDDKSLDDVLESLGQDVIDAVKDGGYETVESLKGISQRKLVALPEIGKAKAKRIAALIAKA